MLVSNCDVVVVAVLVFVSDVTGVDGCSVALANDSPSVDNDADDDDAPPRTWTEKKAGLGRRAYEYL